MKRIILAFIACLLLAAPALAAITFPDLELQGEISAEERAYLGVGEGAFTVSDIDADFLLVEVLSMYCPICQREAPDVNALYERIVARDKAERIRFIGIAAGNTPFEVKFYKKKYELPFPLFEDPNYTAHKALDEVGTPAYYLVDMREGRMSVIYYHEGEMPDKDGFFNNLMELAGE